MDQVHHRMSVRSRRPWLGFRPTACGNTRETSFRPASAKDGEGRRFVTPRQTCPRPEGLGRNLRSKTRWFTGFCNSHQVSHFATFFIDARAEISVAESRVVRAADRTRDLGTSRPQATNAACGRHRPTTYARPPFIRNQRECAGVFLGGGGRDWTSCSPVPLLAPSGPGRLRDSAA